MIRTVIVLGVLFVVTAKQCNAGEFLVFPSLSATRLSRQVSGIKQSEANPNLDFFYTGDYEKARLLAEYSASPDMHEFERLQLGWRLNPYATAWIGRFHNSVGYWSTAFHHSSYLQTTISSPGIAFDDEGGPFPTHIRGMLIEGIANDGAISYRLSLGKGPVMKDQLEPQDIMKRGSSGGKQTVSAELAFTPPVEGEAQIGVFTSYADIPAPGQTINEIKQHLAGMFLNYEKDRTRLLGEVYRASNQLDGIAARATFTSAYFQGEYKTDPDWTVFGRIENTPGASQDPYLDLLPMFIKSRLMAGARYEIAPHHAVKLELSRNAQQDGTHYSKFEIQWSMVFP